MDRSVKLALVALLSALVAQLAACTPDRPETQFSWGVNDHIGRTAPAASPARTYAYEGDNYAVPVPKPRPQYTPAAQQADYARSVTARLASSGTFAWPASGKVISNFGAASNGERNDGINISIPMDTPIHAAASGTVTYSGNELKTYGNLILIRHDDGYVTAYAHADKILVIKGQAVTRGQVIGYSGSSGDVPSPQLHFEIRHDTHPVDPKALLVAQNS
jgi:murein DD-endopeptidase MepM/ murein hydrolase activator NlpD